MANLRVNLNIASTDVLSSALNLSLEKVMSVDSGNLIRAIYVANQCSDRAYLYIKNLETDLENYIYIHNDTDTGLVAKIGGGEFAFIPLNPDKKHEVYATKVDTMIEYGVFGNDNSANQYGGT